MKKDERVKTRIMGSDRLGILSVSHVPDQRTGASDVN